MPGLVRIGGVWREVAQPYVRVGGTWREVEQAWTRVGGTWREWFASGAVAGYMTRGRNSSTVFKWAFPTETVSTTTSLPLAVEPSTALSNLGVAGFVNRNNATEFYKITYPTDTVSTDSAVPDQTGNAGTAQNGGVAGYLLRNRSTTTHYKFPFATSSWGTTTAFSFTVTNARAGISNQAVAIYYPRGSSAAGNFTTDVRSFAVPADTISSLSTPISLAGQFTNGNCVNKNVSGYFNAGSDFLTTVLKLSFATNTFTSLSVPNNTSENAGFNNSNNAGYLSRSSSQTTVYKIAFPADTVSTTTAAPDTMRGNSGFQNG